MKIIKKFINPSKAITVTSVCVFLILLCCAVLCIVFDFPEPIAYVLYALSAFSLCYVVYLIVYGCIKIKPRIMKASEKFTFTDKLMHDYGFRTMVFAFCSFTINFGYALFNGIYGIIFGQLWYCSLSVYYIILCIARGSVVSGTRKLNIRIADEEKREEQKTRIYRATGVILIVLSLALESVLWIMINGDGGFRYKGVLIFVAAGYTLYKVIMAIYNLNKVRGTGDFAVRAVRNINFADALVSLLALHTAMLAAFGGDAANIAYGNLNALFGTAICIYTLVMGIYMIVTATRTLKKRTSGELTATEEN